jgi:septum formation protein
MAVCPQILDRQFRRTGMTVVQPEASPSPGSSIAGRLNFSSTGYAWQMLYLASKSPRRLELLRQLGIDPELLDVDVPEVRLPTEPAADYVNRVAREKAGAGLLLVMSAPGALVLGADTEVILDDVVYGKPVDDADAARMLRELSGRSHRVVTAVWLMSADREEHAVQESEVVLAPLSEADIADYLDSGEWKGKAGGYAIQGRAGAFVAHLAGSHSSVMGLPLHETWRLLRKFDATPTGKGLSSV